MAAPHKMAVSILGILLFQIIVSKAKEVESCPKRMDKMSANGIEIEPNITFNAMNIGNVPISSPHFNTLEFKLF